MIGLWSLRFSAAKGRHWAHERSCTSDTIKNWLEIYRNDEPNVLFLGSVRKPPIS